MLICSFVAVVLCFSYISCHFHYFSPLVAFEFNLFLFPKFLRYKVRSLVGCLFPILNISLTTTSFCLNIAFVTSCNFFYFVFSFVSTNYLLSLVIFTMNYSFLNNMILFNFNMFVVFPVFLLLLNVSFIKV